MNKTLLADRIAERCDVSAAKAEKMINTFIEEVIDVTKNGGKVELRRFGTFQLATRKGRLRNNPITSVSAWAPPYVTLVFRPAKELRKQ